MKRVIAVSVALWIAGCAQAQQATDWLASERTRQAASNLKSLAMAFDCGLVVSGAALSRTVAQIVEAGDGAIGAAGKVYAVSAAICESLGGAPSAQPVPIR